MTIRHVLIEVTMAFIMAHLIIRLMRLRRWFDRRRNERVLEMLRTPFGQDPIAKTPENVRYVGPSLRRSR